MSHTPDKTPSGFCGAGPGPPSPPLLADLLVDQRLRWRRGQRQPVEDYVAQSPALTSDPESLPDLIFNEIISAVNLAKSPCWKNTWRGSRR
jgi:hypothetical protein